MQQEIKVESTVRDLKQVQADEIKVKTQKGTFWMALAIWVQPRLWIGGVVSAKRDLNLIQALDQSSSPRFDPLSFFISPRFFFACNRFS